MKAFLAAATLALAVTGSAAAADANGNYTVAGAGAHSCGSYLASPREVSVIVGVWMQGYVTALNQVMPDTKDVTGGRTDAQMEQELVRVCKKQPDLMLADATREVFVKMIGAPARKSAKAEAPAEALPELRR
jgi:opacity protein-like surface antigen